MNKVEALANLKKQMMSCSKCSLWIETPKIVFGEGNPDADIIFVGESSGENESKTGRPFCGKAGILLTKILKSINLTRDNIFITNIIHCRPPNNRDPKDDEVSACIDYLKEQIHIIQPKVIVLLGAVALKSLFQDPKLGIGKNRGIWHNYENVPVMPTYHPAFLLRQMSEKNKNNVKSDLNLVINKCREIGSKNKENKNGI